MFVVTQDLKRKLAAPPIIWVKHSDGGTGYYWPLYGLTFKLKNFVPLPIEPDKLLTEWRYVPCSILCNGEKFKTYQCAEKEIIKILAKAKEDNKKRLVQAEVSEVEDEVEVEGIEMGVGVDVVEEVDIALEEVDIAGECIDEAGAQANEVEPESEHQKTFDYFPINEVLEFKANEGLRKTNIGTAELEEFYGKINEKAERNFFNVLVKETFTDTFFLDHVHFKKDSKKKKEENYIQEFDTTRLYECMRDAAIKKLKLDDLDNTQLKKMFVANFERIKRAIRAQIKAASGNN